MTLKSFALASLLAVLPLTGHAQFVDTEWRVTAFTGEAWFIKPDDVIGKTQQFYKGDADGAFFQCPYAGMSKTYTTYSVDDFLANPEFKLFAPAAEGLRQGGQKVFVHRISCAGKGDPAMRRVIYPFVTTEKPDAAYYLFEGGFFTLKNNQPAPTKPAAQKK